MIQRRNLMCSIETTNLDAALEKALQEAAARHTPLSPDEFGSIARSVSSATETPTVALRPRFRFRLAALATFVLALIITSAPLLARVLDRLQEISSQTGIEERRPTSPGPGYQRAEEPYVSVQPLMRYAGSDVPVVPKAALTNQDGHRAVFVIDVSAARHGSDGTVTVRTEAVVPGRSYGKAVAIDSGLSPCSRVVVDPSPELEDGDQIRYYQANGPSIDYKNLFGGRPEALPPPIEGGIAYEKNGLVRVTIYHHGSIPPDGSLYEFSSSDGSTQRVPYDDPAEVKIAKEDLEPEAPIGNVKLIEPAGRVLAQGPLDWYCLPYATE
jgi:hypothetical protein